MREDASSTQDVRTSTNIGQDDVLKTNWPFATFNSLGNTTITYKDYVIVDALRDCHITVKERDSDQIVYDKTYKEKIGCDIGYITDIAYNDSTKELFILTTDQTNQYWTLYVDTATDESPKIMASGESVVVAPTMRISLDHTTLSFMSYTADIATQKILKTYFHIVDLNDPTNIIRFERPGNVEKYIQDNHLQYSGSLGINNIVGAYRIAGDTVEFSSYYAKDTKTGYAQISDKELWSYDRTTKKLTLIQTIPVKK